ncbi:MAG: hypothetical protein DMF66_19525 [Acidobacteria bacterium]|nr:MAG: hypothetical protein DMF66_19525 [Acidobacteriota bacterium]
MGGAAEATTESVGKASPEEDSRWDAGSPAAVGCDACSTVGLGSGPAPLKSTSTHSPVATGLISLTPNGDSSATSSAMSACAATVS